MPDLKRSDSWSRRIDDSGDLVARHDRQIDEWMVSVEGV
jgi:hypothetical protein